MGKCKGDAAQKLKCAPDFTEAEELDEIDDGEQLTTFWCPVCKNYIWSYLPYDNKRRRVVYDYEYAATRWARIK
jgi:hypothetical protein